MSTCKISRTDAVAVCVALGFRTAGKWDKERMLRKLKDLGGDDFRDLLVEGKDEKRLNKILADLRAADEIVVTKAAVEEDPVAVAEEVATAADVAEEESKPTKKGKKPEKKVKPEEEKPEEEEQEEEEQEEEAPKKKSKKGKASAVKEGDWVHVAEPEEEEEWDGQVLSIDGGYATVKDSSGHEWDEALGVLTVLAEPPQVEEPKVKKGKKTNGAKSSGTKEKSNGKKGAAEKDRFGSRAGSSAAAINAVLDKKGKTYEQIAEAAGCAVARVRPHVYSIVQKGFVKVEKGKVVVL